MPQCSVSSCSNYYNKTRGSSSIIYHIFPTSPTRIQKWSQACGRNKQIRVNFARICSAHFSPKCYSRDLQHELLGLPLRKKLKPDAVPDINLPSQSSTVHAVDNEISGTRENEKVNKSPTRPSIRIARKRSISGSYKALQDDGDHKVLQNSTNKIDFRQELNLKHGKIQSVNKSGKKSYPTAVSDAICSKKNVVTR